MKGLRIYEERKKGRKSSSSTGLCYLAKNPENITVDTCTPMLYNLPVNSLPIQYGHHLLFVALTALLLRVLAPRLVHSAPAAEVASIGRVAVSFTNCAFSVVSDAVGAVTFLCHLVRYVHIIPSGFFHEPRTCSATLHGSGHLGCQR